MKKCWLKSIENEDAPLDPVLNLWRPSKTRSSLRRVSNSDPRSNVSASKYSPFTNKAASGGWIFKCRPKTSMLCFISFLKSSETCWWSNDLAWIGKFCEVNCRICRASSPWISATRWDAWRPNSWNSHAFNGAISSFFSRSEFRRRSKEWAKCGRRSLKKKSLL